MKVVIYKAPHGRQEVVDITNVNKEDEKFFNTNNIVISMEEVMQIRGMKTKMETLKNLLRLRRGVTVRMF
tara:strand:- start:18780 stop:18989 length:210 start_codon:yes stop_codon:yes gene_type:complete